MLADDLARVAHREGVLEHGLRADRHIGPAGFLGKLAARPLEEVLPVVQPAARGRPVRAVRRPVVIAEQQHPVLRVEHDDAAGAPQAKR